MNGWPKEYIEWTLPDRVLIVLQEMGMEDQFQRVFDAAVRDALDNGLIYGVKQTYDKIAGETIIQVFPHPGRTVDIPPILLPPAK